MDAATAIYGLAKSALPVSSRHAISTKLEHAIIAVSEVSKRINGYDGSSLEYSTSLV
jgi:hypothetical protein